MAVRTTLVELAGQARSDQALPFLAEALADVEPRVWKQALDGLVSIGGPRAASLLHLAMAGAPPEKASWIAEALEQVREGAGQGES